MRASLFKRHNQKGQAQLAEFAISLVFLFMIFAFFVDIFIFFAGVATVAMMANVTARSAGPSATWSQAVSNVNTTCCYFENGSSVFKSFYSMAHATPDSTVAGGDPCAGSSSQTPAGMKVEIIAINNGQATNLGAGPVAVLDTSGNTIYHYSVTAVFDVQPLLGIPGILPNATYPNGYPVTFTSTSYAEHPEGLNK